MKKFIALVVCFGLLLGLVFVLSACTGGESKPAETSVEEPVSTGIDETGSSQDLVGTDTMIETDYVEPIALEVMSEGLERFKGILPEEVYNAFEEYEVPYIYFDYFSKDGLNHDIESTLFEMNESWKEDGTIEGISLEMEDGTVVQSMSGKWFVVDENTVAELKGDDSYFTIMLTHRYMYHDIPIDLVITPEYTFVYIPEITISDLTEVELTQKKIEGEWGGLSSVILYSEDGHYNPRFDYVVEKGKLYYVDNQDESKTKIDRNAKYFEGENGLQICIVGITEDDDVIKGEDAKGRVLWRFGE